MPQQVIEIEPYNQAWPVLADAAIAELRGSLPNVLQEIEHIGSTAVPGLAAKPIIDLMASVDQLSLVEQQESALVRLGYRRHLNGMTDRLLYVRTVDGTKTHILHVVDAASWPTRNQRILRDYLREHPEDVARYAQLKRDIAATGIAPGDYSRAKTEFIQEVTDRARAERGLPSVPVWEKGPVAQPSVQPRRPADPGHTRHRQTG